LCGIAGEVNLLNVRALVEDCCGWNRKTWADAVEFAVSQLPERLDGQKILEIGAGKHSSISPIFSGRGAELLCSYYHQQQEDVENGRLRFVIDKYKLAKIPVAEVNINEVEGIYDIIVLKSVLGGVCRGDDYGRLRLIVDGLLAKNIREGGALLTFDNGYVKLFKMLRRSWGAGRNDWTYFTRHGLISSLSGHEVRIQGFGFLSVGAARFLLHGNFEFLNDIIYLVDKAILHLVKSDERAVLSTIIRKIPHQGVGGTAG
jgi:hypothetical protein